MPAEAVIIEKTETDLTGFDWTQYVQYFPENAEASSELERLFRGSLRGWKYRARLCMHAHDVFMRYQAVLEAITESVSSEPKVKAVKSIPPRDGLVAYLSSLHDKHLETLSIERNVSYNSFMNTNDRIGLVEALADEMVTV